MRRAIINPCHIYTWLWCLYYSQGILYPSGSAISQGTIGVIIVLSFYYFIKFCRGKFTLYHKGLMWVFALVNVYGIVALIGEGMAIKGMVSDTNTISWFKNMFMSILPIFTYSYFCKKGYLTTKFLQWMFPIFFLTAIMHFYHTRLEVLEQFYGTTLHVDVGITNNAGYMFLSLIPMLIIYDKQRLLQYAGLALCLVWMLFAMKRGALLIGAIVTIFIVLRSLRVGSRWQKLFTFIVIVVAAHIVYQVMVDMFEHNDYFLARINATEAGNSSGRDDIFSTLWEHFIHLDNYGEIIFGSGVWATTKFTWTAAHNDWLEFITDMGLFGVAIYIAYWCCFLRTIYTLNLPESARFTLKVLFIIAFMRTMFSMSISEIAYTESIMFGLCLCGGIKDSQDNQKTQKHRKHYENIDLRGLLPDKQSVQED